MLFHIFHSSVLILKKAVSDLVQERGEQMQTVTYTKPGNRLLGIILADL